MMANNLNKYEYFLYIGFQGVAFIRWQYDNTKEKSQSSLTPVKIVEKLMVHFG